MIQMQISRKSGVLAFILELLIPGLGFLYAGAWKSSSGLY